MRAKVTGPLADTLAGARAEAVLRACVHCGMCNAVCPTFQLTGDELDGPRGRIYLMKGALEGEPVGAETLLHLDRCLECRACETACPSGVEYHRLLDVGRPFVEAQVRRPWLDRAIRAAIRWLAPHPARFAVAVGIGRFFEPFLPEALRSKLPSPSRGGVGVGGCRPQATTHADRPAAPRPIRPPPPTHSPRRGGG